MCVCVCVCVSVCVCVCVCLCATMSKLDSSRNNTLPLPASRFLRLELSDSNIFLLNSRCTLECVRM